MKKYAKLLPLILIMFPLVVLAIGGTKRIIDLPGFTTDRLLFVDANNELQDTGITVGGSDDTLSGIASLNGITSTTLGYVDFTSSGQTQLDAKLDDFAGTADNALVRTNGTGGDAVQETGLIVDDSDNISGLQAITAEAQTATVSTPGAGSLSMYFKSDGNLYKKDENGIEQQIGSASSGINYFSDFQADIIGNVAEFDDTSAIVDGTGGSPANLATSLETTNPLSGQASYKLQKDVGANAQYEGFSIDTDTPDRTSTAGGETVYVTFNYETSANYDNDSSGEQVSIYVYRVGSNTLESCNARDVLSGTFTNALPVAPDGGQYQCVTTLSSSDTSVRVIFGITGTGTSTWDIVVDKIKVGPDAVVTAPIVTEWQSYTTTITNGGTTSTDLAEYMRDGPNLYVKIYTVFNGSGSAGTLSYSLPSGLTADTAAGDSVEGIGRWFNSGVDENVGFAAVSGNNLVIQIDDGGSFLNGTDIASGDRVSIDAKIKITEYANSNAILSTTQADHQTVRVQYQVSGSTANSSFADAVAERVDFDSLVVDTHNAVTTGASWVFTAPRTADYLISPSWVWNTSTNLFAGYLSYKKNGGSSIFVCGIAGTEQNIMPCSTTLLPLNKGDTLYFEAYQDDSTSAARAVFTGTSSSIAIQSLPDFSTFSTYGPYEYTEAIVGSPRVETATFDVYVDATGGSVSLTQGTWSVCYGGSIFIEWVSGASGASCKTVLRDGSNNDITGSSRLHSLILDGTYSSSVVPTGDVCSEVTIADTTTYKMSIKSAASAAASKCSWWYGGWTGGITDPDGEAKIWARRMK